MINFNIKCYICNFEEGIDKFNILESDCIFPKIDNINQHLIRYQCPNCDVIFGTIQMIELPKEQMALAYEAVYKDTNYDDGDTSDFQLETFLMTNPKKDGIYLNWGAGKYGPTEKAKSLGYSILDYDPYVEHLNDKKYTKSEEIFNHKFDAIYSHNLIEHLQTPIEDLKLMKSLLKPDGFMIHATDCYRYKFEFTKYHLFFFVGKSLDILGEKTGFKSEFIGDIRVKFTLI